MYKFMFVFALLAGFMFLPKKVAKVNPVIYTKASPFEVAKDSNWSSKTYNHNDYRGSWNASY